jgi:arylsulfatase A
MKKNNYSPFLLSILLIVGINYKMESQEKPMPNIIVVLADDLGYGDISIYQDNNKIKTPNIDKIATEGIKFTDAHTPSSVCTPTRYGLLTGRYNWRSELKSGVLTGKSKALIPSSRSTIASILKTKGYNTAFIGKWHLGWDWAIKDEKNNTGEGWDEKDFISIDFAKSIKNGPKDLGFEYSYGHSGSLDMAPYVYVENGKATQIPETSTVNTGKYSWWRKGPTSKDFIHEDVTPNAFRKGIKYVQEQSKTSKPFFLYLALPSPHTPILPSKDWEGKSELNPYGDFMLMIDDYMGKLLGAIDEAGINDNTIVIFTSDNGCSPTANIEELKAKGHFPNSIYRGHKADIFEGGHRVPFIVKWPKKIKKESISNETICLTDLMATFAEIANYKLKDNEAEDSYSLMPIFEEKKLSSPLREATVHHSINGSFAIRKNNWKLIMCPDSGGWSYPKPEDKTTINTLPKVQLYDLSNDPKELNNLEATQPEKVKELKLLLGKYISDGRSTPGKHQKNDASKSEWKQIDFIKE